jgi:hypothetical protein
MEKKMPDKLEKSGKFKLCGTGIGLGLLAVVLTVPLWGIFVPTFITNFSPLLANIFSVAIPVAAFSVVLWKTCSKPSDDSKSINDS